jgi:hypothetical protein
MVDDCIEEDEVGEAAVNACMESIRQDYCCWVSCPHRTKLSVRPVTTVKLLGIKFRNRRWPTTFHTITAGDADGWC